MVVAKDGSDRDDEAETLLRAKLLGETATAPWRELQRFFAQGLVVWVAPGLDLIEVGLAMSGDRADPFRRDQNVVKFDVVRPRDAEREADPFVFERADHQSGAGRHHRPPAMASAPAPWRTPSATRSASAMIVR